MPRLTKNKQRKSSSKGSMKNRGAKRKKNKASAKKKHGSSKTKQKQGKGRSAANQAIIDKVKLAKKRKAEARNNAIEKLRKEKGLFGRFSTPSEEAIKQQMQKDAADFRNFVDMKAELEEDRKREAAEMEEDRKREAAKKQKAQEATRRLDHEYRLRMKQMFKRLPAEAEVAAHTTLLNNAIRASAGAAGEWLEGLPKGHIIDILSNKLSTPSKTGCYEIKNTVWKNANIPFGSTRKLTRKCINKLIDIISRNLMYFPNGLFNRTDRVTKELGAAINSPLCIACKDGHDAGGDDTETLLEDPDLSAPTGFAKSNKNKSKSKKKVGVSGH
jgi:hypothetical protein